MLLVFPSKRAPGAEYADHPTFIFVVVAWGVIQCSFWMRASARLAGACGWAESPWRSSDPPPAAICIGRYAEDGPDLRLCETVSDGDLEC